MGNARTLYTTEAGLLRALAHPTRLQIMDVLRGGEACVCHIQAMLGLRQANISQHLMALREAGLVTSRKEGLRVYYQMRDRQVLNVLDGVGDMACAHNGDMESAAARPPRVRCNCPQCAERK